MDDLISKQAVVDLIMETDLWWFEGKTMEILRGIKKLPAIDPVKHGKWEETGDKGGRNYACNCCRFAFIVDTCMGEPMWNYCPNCGAKMERGE